MPLVQEESISNKPTIVSRMRRALRAIRGETEAFVFDSTRAFGAAMLALQRGSVSAVTVKKDDCPGCAAMSEMTKGLNVVTLESVSGGVGVGVVEVDAKLLDEKEAQYISTVPAIFLLSPTDGVFRYTGKIDAESMGVFTSHSSRSSASEMWTVMGVFMNAPAPAPPSSPSPSPSPPPAPLAEVIHVQDAASALSAFNGARAKGEPTLLAICALDCGWSLRFLDMLKDYRGVGKIVAYSIDTRMLPPDAQGIMDLYTRGSSGGALDAFPAWILSTRDGRVMSSTGAEQPAKIFAQA